MLQYPDLLISYFIPELNCLLNFQLMLKFKSLSL